MLGYTLTNLIASVPEGVVLVGGVILLLTARQRLPKRAVTLAVTGCALGLVTSLLIVCWGVVLPTLFDPYHYHPISAAVSFLLSLCRAAALALLIAAVLAHRTATAASSAPYAGGWPPMQHTADRSTTQSGDVPPGGGGVPGAQ